jgi:hypothetical protein
VVCMASDHQARYRGCRVLGIRLCRRRRDVIPCQHHYSRRR